MNKTYNIVYGIRMMSAIKRVFYSYDTQLGRYIVHGTSTATEKNEFFLHFIS